ncbi:hypothetical protein CANCADRAFT_76748 [Tortispora caseinolytica NRRL Y-17796]|uniref:Pentafunctional AROM polypeptide n=1 Tax=Tortispora caseinolytica NRRL Y-17796 TaxID=767744 RepID=A0A1E4TJD1_9ASCO|nr:hypothetical protein CANCADRAFT_76748 [Tortispora caseinolytica NRRL Y-17796]
MDIHKVSILGTESIWIGYDSLNEFMKEIATNLASSTYVLITDTHLAPLHLPRLQKAWAHTGSTARLLTYTILPGETSKSRSTKAAIEDWMLENGCTRDTVILAVGGGVIGDMIGYVAATFMRGVRFVQIPTSLLAMVDSSIGGKTAIDTPHGKNLVGAFWQPKYIFIDLKFLETLPVREFINGMAEVIKTAAIWDAEEFCRLENDASLFMDTILSRRDPENPSNVDLSPVREMLARIVKGSAAIKAQVVTLDEREGGLRNILNFGHSIGHAYEAVLTPFILHGECVAIGMVKEAELSRFLGTLSSEAVARITKILLAYHLPISVTDEAVRSRAGDRIIPTKKLIQIMAVDKKNDGAKKKVVLLKAIGETYEKKATVVSDSDIAIILSPHLKVSPSLDKIPSSTTVIPPGSKSISNRALVLAAMSSGKCKIQNLLHSDDTEHMITALIKLNAAEFSWEDNGKTLVVKGNGGKMNPPNSQIYLGNAGTASRFLTSIACLVPASSGLIVLTGNERMQERPIGPLVDTLRANGCQIEYVNRDGSLPLNIAAGSAPRGGRITLAATTSSQYVSSILMAAPFAQEAVTLSLVGGNPVSLSYVDMTIEMMRAFGISVQKDPEQAYTYHIPKAVYNSPELYVIESDASSATYPLAMAAITGTTCEVPSIGYSSLQGDAKFAVDVLKPMGCTVIQTENSTKVTGPPVGTLKPLPSIDMEPMTDAFLTACVLAAVAPGVTSIYGIANQHVKECDRIAAMCVELAKLGVKCVNKPDGIDIHGINVADLKETKEFIDTYDDHRVAMSFSVLAAVYPFPLLIENRKCVDKTWPAWWDCYHGDFKVELTGFDSHEIIASPGSRPRAVTSIFVIGMRGAGKSTLSQWISAASELPLVDMDKELERIHKRSIKDIVAVSGWAEFRHMEADLLRDLYNSRYEKPVIVSCGGGIVESEESRKLFQQIIADYGIVIHVHRNIHTVHEYLMEDETRPAYGESILDVWERRKTWYQECSSHLIYAPHFTAEDNSLNVKKNLADIAQRMIGDTKSMDNLLERERTFFLSLTFADLNEAATIIDKAVTGSSAVELRVDLLRSPEQADGIPDPSYVTEQVALLRKLTCLPIIYTVRTESQGGQFPDHAYDEAEELILLGVRMCVEFVDLESTFPDKMKDRIFTAVNSRSITKIIASFHDWEGKYKWNDIYWNNMYAACAQHGSVVKLVSLAKQFEDNLALLEFKKMHPTKPLIAINMGRLGQASRIMNGVLTPVTHSLLPIKAAPGQLSVRQVHKGLSLLGHPDVEPLKFFIVGKPIAHSRSPALHNGFFKEVGLPYVYERMETDDITEVQRKIIELGDSFGGASVTVPLKLDAMRVIQKGNLSAHAQAIGAINTVTRDVKTGEMYGDNTDWLGIKTSIEYAAGFDHTFHGASGLVIGAGGTSRAAVYALHKLGISTIYVLNRTISNIESLQEHFKELNIVPILNIEDTRAASFIPPVVAVSCISGEIPLGETMLKTILSEVLKPRSLLGPRKTRRVLLEMAYKPRLTQIMQLAEFHGWNAIPGLNPLVAQGIEQFKIWTGLEAPWSLGQQFVLG